MSSETPEPFRKVRVGIYDPATGETEEITSEGSLDEAWADAEAALPKDWSFGLTPYWQDGGWYGWEVEAHAAAYEFDANRVLSTGNLGAFPTPAAALQALAAHLRETPR